MLCASLQMKCFSLFGIGKLQICFHITSSPPPCIDTDAPPVLLSLRRLSPKSLYADLTKKTPFLSKCQETWSSQSTNTSMTIINSASSAQNVDHTRSSSHVPVIGLMSSDTFYMSTRPLGVHGLRVHVLGIHGSSQICTLSLFPIRQIKPSSCMLERMLLHVYDIPSLGFASLQEQFGKYLAFSTSAHREFGFFISLHACLASIPMLKAWISLNPRSPWLFGGINFS